MYNFTRFNALKMKKKKIIDTLKWGAAVFVCLLSMQACTKQLDQVPVTQKVLSSFIQNQTEVEEYVDAVYGMLQWNGTYGLYFPALGEIPSDNTYDEVPANDSQMYGQLDEFATVPGNGLIASVWRDHYRAIQGANVVLNRIGGVAFTDQVAKASRVGEMQFIRAMLYFNLVRTFGDVPLVLEETSDPNVFFGQGRTNKLQVYQQVIADLESAIENLPVIQTKKGKITKHAANALLGKVYLAQGKPAEAKRYFLEVVNAKRYKLVDIDRVFAINNENNEEIIFDVQFASGINGNKEGSSMQQQFSPSGTLANAKGHNLPTRSMYNLFAAEDLRKQYYVGLTSNNIPFSKKLAVPTTAPADGGSNFVVIRYADILLLLAEIESNAGNEAAALGYLNPVRERAGLKSFKEKELTPDALKAAVELERRLELICEGHRWFDLIRYGTAVQVMNKWFKAEGVNISVDADDLQMPIPQGQIDTDPSIIQNDGY